MSRATVDLPQPDSPTSPSVSPRSEREVNTVDRFQPDATLSFQHAIEPRRRDVEMPRYVGEL